MSIHLPMMAQNLFNTPLLISPQRAEMIVAALSGKLDISALTTETRHLDQASLMKLAEHGRMDAALTNDKMMMARRAINIPEAPMMAAFYGDRPYRLSTSGIAVIEVLGTLTRSYGIDPESGTTGYDGVWTKLAFAMDDPSCKAIWLKINSGGGAVDGLFDLTDAIAKCSARNGGKPIWAFAGDYAFSAAYAIAAAADKVYTPMMGSVGSIGALAIWADLTGALEKDGIKAFIWRSEARKAIGVGGIESMDQEEIDHIQARIDAAGAYFKTKVAEYRGISISKVSQTRGSDYSATDAKAVGLIDGILSEPDAWAKLERTLH
jgi:ClpP class serine protease